mmetsp:Transcript_1695/g.3693  ORF Transcript_1695/g.3693 Transcript_1695/m.3693 type:complete len:97 (+) Transcript_1695:313-603(+)
MDGGGGLQASEGAEQIPGGHGWSLGEDCDRRGEPLFSSVQEESERQVIDLKAKSVAVSMVVRALFVGGITIEFLMLHGIHFGHSRYYMRTTSKDTD